MKIRILLVVLAMLFIRANLVDKVTVFMVGDSTMANKKPEKSPETGWGQVFGSFFNDNVRIVNTAMDGRSTKRFVNEGRWDRVLERLKPNDYVFIQFGHNDAKLDKEGTGVSPQEFETYLVKFVNDCRAKKAIPVLITPVMRRSFRNNKFYDSHGEYPQVTKKVAKDMDVALIDLHQKSEVLISGLGSEPSKKLFMWLDSGVNANYPSGKRDNTHFNEYGAQQIAQLVVNEIKQSNLDLKKYIK
ncbi:rhamnogalacturonan acetylesterase [Pedobacter sp.]